MPKLFKIKKIVVLVLFTFFITNCLFAQYTPSALKIGKISGQIIDSQSNSPLEYATIALFSERDSSLITGTITNPNGNFNLTDIPAGKYYARIDFLGYKRLIKSGLNITLDNPEIKLRKIAIEPSSATLEGVNIVADRPLYQNQIDRKVINPEQDIMSAGGTALNVLENAPSVEVDVEGNVALRGNTSVTILIDGRPSGYSGEAAGDLLQQIPSNAIDRIEVLTNPSSKYSPEGITGIINIILKKNSYGGFNGSVTAGVGTLLDYNGGANLNFRNDKINFYSNLGANNRKWESSGSNNRETYYQGDTTYYQQSSDNKSDGLNLSARAGIDFFVNKKNTFTLTGRVNGGNRDNSQTTDYHTFNIKYPLRHYTAPIDNDGSRFSYNAGAVWEKIFSSKNHFLLFDASFGKRNNDNTSTYNQYDYFPKDTIYYNTWHRNVTNGSTQDFEGKVDYAMPIKKEGKLELGGSARLRSIENDLKYKRYDGEKYILQENSSNDFTYDENIYAAYAQFGSKIGNFSYQVGLRGEYANIQGELKAVGQDTTFPNDYFQVYPTAFIMYQIKEFNELKLNYTRRVNRPGPWNLNPFQDVSDPMNIRMGNPKLMPEYINSIELDYFRYLKTGSLSATLYYRHTTDVISRITEVDNVGVSLSTWENLNSNDAYGLELGFNNKFFDFWSLNASFNLGYSKINGEINSLSSTQQINTGGSAWSIKLNNAFQVMENTTLQFNARYVGPRIMAQGKSQGFFVGDIGLKQDFLQKKLSLTLRVSDVFNTMKFVSISESDNFYQKSTRDPRGGIGYLSLTWKFGNMNMREIKKRQTPSSEQQRDAEENGEMY